MATHTLTIERWHPVKLNELINCHWAVRNRKKKSETRLLEGYAVKARIPPATGKRRLSLTIRLRPRQRAGDPDAYWKGLCDSLKSIGLLKDDSRQWLELVPVVYERGTAEDWGSVIVLTDVED